MSRTTVFRASLWLAIPLFAVAGQFAMAANHAPVLDAAKSPVLEPEFQNWGSPAGAMGTLVSALVDFAVPAGQVDNVTDVDAGAKLGIAVTAANTSNGTWWYSLNDGTTWNALGAVTNKSARLLAADAYARIYFTPNANYTGTISNAITFRAWDQTSGTNGGLANTTNNGGSKAFSTATDTASLIVEQLPPVEYQLIWVDNQDPSVKESRVNGLNSSGVGVGYVLHLRTDGSGYDPFAFRWDDLLGMVHLSDLAYTWLDLETNLPVTGWIAGGANEINEAGQIVGYARKDGEPYSKAFFFDSGAGFYLLPRAPGVPEGPQSASGLDGNGNVLVLALDMVTQVPYVLFWSPLNPATTTLVFEGEYLHTNVNTRMIGNFFLTTNPATDAYKLFSYSVESDGTLLYEFDPALPTAKRYGNMSDTNLMPFTQLVSDKYYVKLYNAVLGTTKTLSTSSLNTGVSVGGANSAGDATFVGSDGLGRIYRALEGKSYRLYDLLSASAKAELYTAGPTPISRYEIGGPFAIINDSNVAGVPIGSPYDHIAVPFFPPLGSPGSWRAAVLKPVPK